MDYAKAIEIVKEHRPSVWSRLIRASRCVACRCAWKCPIVIEAERVITEAGDIDEPSEWRLGFGQDGRGRRR